VELRLKLRQKEDRGAFIVVREAPGDRRIGKPAELRGEVAELEESFERPKIRQQCLIRHVALPPLQSDLLNTIQVVSFIDWHLDQPVWLLFRRNLRDHKAFAILVNQHDEFFRIDSEGLLVFGAPAECWVLFSLFNHKGDDLDDVLASEPPRCPC
jgi:hypothetical protein